MISNMKSVVVFSAGDSQEKTEIKWLEWWKNNKSSAVGDKMVPNLEETRRMLNG